MRRRRRLARLAPLLLFALSVVGIRLTKPVALDLVVTGGHIIDGTGAAGFAGTLCVNAGRVIRCPRLRRYRGATVLDASGLVVAPGFIDVHTHVEGNLPKGLDAPFGAWNFVSQGVTTIITGNCGTSYRDIAELRSYFDRFRGQVNLGTLVGHNTIRAEVIGRYVSRDASGQELESIRGAVVKALAEGALGVSTGLAYAPASFAGEDEILAIAGAAADADAIFNAHIRDEGAGGVEALKEVLAVIERAHVRGHISHLKAAGRSQWGTMAERLALIEAVPGVTVDAYPYEASSTDLSPVLPPWFFEVPQAERRRRYGTGGSERSRLRKAMSDILVRAGWTDYRFAQIASYWSDRRLDGLRIPVVAARRGEAATSEAQMDIVIDMALRGGAQMIYHEMFSADVDTVLTWARSMVGSDAGVRSPSMEARPHPRGMGTFPRMLRRYVKSGSAELEDVVNRMTELPASTFGIADRGTLRPGSWADIVVFDMDQVTARATYAAPLLSPIGIRHLFVNGVAVVRFGRQTEARPGVFVARRGSDAPEQGGPQPRDTVSVHER